ncbi:UNVERIFIED_CONTAM: hypothetical protein K2H54_065799, partial [Gekko kuhli]
EQQWTMGHASLSGHHAQEPWMHLPVSVEWCVAVAVWWMANTMSYRIVGQQFGLARSTVAGIVVEVTRAITERLLERVVYLRDPDRDMAWQAIRFGGTCPCNLASTRPVAPLSACLAVDHHLPISSC